MNRKKYEKQAEDGVAMLRKAMDGKTVTVQEMPKPQPYLTTNGKKIFKAICAHLMEHNILCAIDGMYISTIALNIDLFTSMATLIAKKEMELANSLEIWEKIKADLEAEIKAAYTPELYDELKAHYKSKPGDGGYFQTFPNGVVQNSPYVNTMNKAFDIIEKGCAKLGMTPKSRDTIIAFAKVGEPEDQDDELDLYAKVKQALADKNRQS